MREFFTPGGEIMISNVDELINSHYYKLMGHRGGSSISLEGRKQDRIFT
jgi:hypothetical protein